MVPSDAASSSFDDGVEPEGGVNRWDHGSTVLLSFFVSWVVEFGSVHFFLSCVAIWFPSSRCCFLNQINLFDGDRLTTHPVAYIVYFKGLCFKPLTAVVRHGFFLSNIIYPHLSFFHDDMSLYHHLSEGKLDMGGN